MGEHTSKIDVIPQNYEIYISFSVFLARVLVSTLEYMEWGELGRRAWRESEQRWWDVLAAVAEALVAESVSPHAASAAGPGQRRPR